MRYLVFCLAFYGLAALPVQVGIYTALIVSFAVSLACSEVERRVIASWARGKGPRLLTSQMN